jgi:hypothetical protein
MSHSDSGAIRTLIPGHSAHFLEKLGGGGKRWLIPKCGMLFLEEQGGRHGQGAINREENQRNIEIEV